MHSNKICFVLCLMLVFCIFSSCKYDLPEFFYRKNGVETRSAKITDYSETDLFSEELKNSDKYSVVLISDVHFGAKMERKDADFLEWFKNQCEQTETELKPAFVVCLGDCVEHGEKSEYEDYLVFCEEIKKIALESMGNDNFKIFSIAGNHDLYNSGWEHFEEMVYPNNSFYTLNVNSKKDSFHWYFLDSASGTLGRKQLKLVNGLFKKDKNPKIVLTHYPVNQDGLLYFTTQNTDERDYLLNTFAISNSKLIFAGHHHPGGEHDFGDFMEIGVPSFNQFRECGLLTVDEVNKSYVYKKVDFCK